MDFTLAIDFTAQVEYFSSFSCVFNWVCCIFCGHVKIMAGMTSLPHGNSANCSLLCERGPISFMGISALPSTQLRVRAFDGLVRGQLVLLLSLNFSFNDLGQIA